MATELENYEPKGELKGFPKEIIARMLECQKEQGNKIDVSVFEKHRTSDDDGKGFNWSITKEGSTFWENIIRHKNFTLFFERYPKKEEIKVCSKCKEHKKQEYQELKQKKNMITEELEKKLKISKNTCIHCPTLELAKQVLNIFHQLGLKWCSGNHYIKYTNWDKHKENTVYYPFDGDFSSLKFAHSLGCKNINAEEFIALHTEKKEEFDLENYEPKGDLVGFPKEIISRMLDYQEEQGNSRDISVFEKQCDVGRFNEGFDWDETQEGFGFWEEVIDNKNFYPFFEKYPQKDHDEPKTAKYVQVDDNTILSDIISTQSSVEIEINTTEDNPQAFKVGDEVIYYLTNKTGIVTEIRKHKFDNDIDIVVDYGNNDICEYEISSELKRPFLLHYRDDYDYDVIDFNNLPKRQETKRWRAEKNRIYYYVNFYTKDWFLPDETYDYYTPMDHDNYYSGNYFRTEVEAEIIVQKLNTYMRQLIKEEHE